MSEPFTKGPWSARKFNDTKSWTLYGPGNGSLGNIKTEANARLIAASPDLLEALAWVRANYASGSTKEINARIDAALAKAIGDAATEVRT